MTFYKNYIKRQAYFKNHSGQFLSKSPFACAKIGSLYEYFPGSKIIFMVRNPLEVIPSMINMAHEIWRSTLNINSGYQFQDKIYEAALHYHNYPLNRLQVEPENAYAIIKYDDLMTQPTAVVEAACRKLGIELDAGFLKILQEEEDKAKQYKSGHIYSLEKVQISKEKIVMDFRDIFERLNFEVPR